MKLSIICTLHLFYMQAPFKTFKEAIPQRQRGACIKHENERGILYEKNESSQDCIIDQWNQYSIFNGICICR